MVEVLHTKGTITLYEGCLNDDFVQVLEDGYYYKGHNKAQVVLFYYTYANEWSNHEHKKFFKTLENAIEWYKKSFKDRAIYQGRVWLTDGGEDYTETDEDGIVLAKDEDALNEFDNLTLYCEL
jgi:hypothetical protein